MKEFHVSPFYGNPKILHTSSPSIEDDLFGAIEYFSEVEEIGLVHVKAFRTYSFPNRKHFLLFQSFIRQAITHYKSAQTLHHRASPLLYYYSFLNFAKAYACLRDPKPFTSKIAHGLSHSMVVTKKFGDQKISIQRKGVFPVFYRELFKTPSPTRTIKILDALGYVTDIGYEYQSFGRSKVHHGISRANSDGTNIWPIVAITGSGVLSANKKVFGKFLKSYEQVEVPEQLTLTEFGLDASQLHSFSFFESKKLYSNSAPFVVQNMQRDLYELLEPVFGFSPYDDMFNLTLNEPLSKNLQKPFNEVVAIYCAMFYICSLVRYHPYYLEKLLMSKEAWLLERFIKSAPLTYLRHMVNLISNDLFIYRSR